MKSSRHLYSGGPAKVAWFVRRFGLKELFLKPARAALAPWILKSLPEGSFDFGDVVLPYFHHRYNCTWVNERCIEIPIARHYLGRYAPQDVLEVGNVLAHYQPISHTVVDKYETGAAIINEDIIGFQPHRQFRLIISISTFEHIGFDDAADSGSTHKILEALASCRALLAKDGQLVITVPLGYNPGLDAMIADGSLGRGKFRFWRRAQPRVWVSSDLDGVRGCRYGRPFPYANALLVGEF